MVAVVNKWWGTPERKREQLLNDCKEFNLNAHFAQIPNIHALNQLYPPPYQLDDSREEGGWLLCRAPNNTATFILPVDPSYFTDDAQGFILVEMFGKDIEIDLGGTGYIFERAFRACELEDTGGGKFKVKKRGILQQPGKVAPSIELPLTFDELVALKSQEGPNKTVWDELGKLKRYFEQLNNSLNNLDMNIKQKTTNSATPVLSGRLEVLDKIETAVKNNKQKLSDIEAKFSTELKRTQEKNYKIENTLNALTEQLKTLSKNQDNIFNTLVQSPHSGEKVKQFSTDSEFVKPSAELPPHKTEDTIQTSNTMTKRPLDIPDASLASKVIGSSISTLPIGWKNALIKVTKKLKPESGYLQHLIRLQEVLTDYAGKYGLQASFVHMSKIQEGQFELHPARLENQQGILSCPGCSIEVREKDTLLEQFFVLLDNPQVFTSWLFLPPGIEIASGDFPSGYNLLIEGESRGKILTITRPAILVRIEEQKNTYWVKTKMQLKLD